MPADDDWAYGLSKAALNHFTRMMAGRYGNNRYDKKGHSGRHVTFNAIAPGPFPGMLDFFLDQEGGAERVGNMTVVGRVGKPKEDIGAACIYLASKAGSFITGAVLPIDGGVLVARNANM